MKDALFPIVESLLRGRNSDIFLWDASSRSDLGIFRDESVDRDSGLLFRIGDLFFAVLDRNCRRVGKLDSSNRRPL